MDTPEKTSLQSSRDHLGFPSLNFSQPRRVLSNGVDRLQALADRKKTEHEMKTLSNRIDRLLKQESTAKKEILKTELELVRRENTRIRYEADKKRKQDWLKIVKAEEEAQRKINREARFSRNSALRSRKIEIRNRMKEINYERRVELIDNENAIIEKREFDKEVKLRSYLDKSEQKRVAAEIRSESECREYKEKKEVYEEKIEADRFVIENLKDRLDEMTRVEGNLLERVSHTMNLKEQVELRLKQAIEESYMTE